MDLGCIDMGCVEKPTKESWIEKEKSPKEYVMSLRSLWLRSMSGKGEASVAAASTSLHQLPDHVVEKIFENLCTADRARMRLVSKSWRRILMQDDIPIALEAPWLILSNHSYYDREYFLSEISFKSSSEESTYRFKLPGNINNNGKDKWCCCGSSNGWLLIAVRTTDMYLWNPISGQTKRLPPLSTLPFINEIVNNAIESREADNISCFIRRMQVFPIGTVECVVAIIFFTPTWIEQQHHQLALCTPHDQSWSAVGGEGEEGLRYNDILFHNEKLYVLLGNDRNSKVVHKVHLTGGCDVEVIMHRFVYNGSALVDVPNAFPIGYRWYKRVRVVEHLVESCLTGELLVVSAIQDFYSLTKSKPGSVLTMRSCETNGFEVRRLTGDCLENMSGSIGKQGIYLGCYGSLSLPAYVNKVEADSINFATDDGTLIVGKNRDGRSLILREQGIFNVQKNKIPHTSRTTTYLPIDLGSIIGWFTPKLF